MSSLEYNLPNIALRLMLPLSPFYAWRNGNTESLSDLLQDTQLRTHGTVTQAQAFWLLCSYCLSHQFLKHLVVTNSSVSSRNHWKICGHLHMWIFKVMADVEPGLKKKIVQHKVVFCLSPFEQFINLFINYFIVYKLFYSLQFSVFPHLNSL